MLPDNLTDLIEYISCTNNKIISLPNLPNCLKYLFCGNNDLYYLPDLPDSLAMLDCKMNELISLPNYLSTSLKLLNCKNNQITYLPDNIPKSLERLNCSFNILNEINIKDNELTLCFSQDKELEFISYNPNIKLNIQFENKILIKGYPYNPITNQDELDEYMEFIFEFNRNKIKSARN